MKLICITPQEDNESIIYLKPDTALLRNNEAFYLPEFSQKIIAYPALIIKIKKMGKKITERFAHRYYDEITVGYNLIAQDILSQNIANQYPWDDAVGFDYSAPIGNSINPKDNETLSFDLNGTVLKIKTSEINIHRFISEVSHKFTLKIGDFIYITLPLEELHLKMEQTLSAKINDKELIQFSVK